jgi:PilZ domain-containing protein
MMGISEERRKRRRVALRWPVRLFRNTESQSVASTTENLTSNGFYCVSSQPFETGERLECIIAIPGGSFGYAESPITLQCRVHVTRVEDLQKGFGLGCYIEDYDLLFESSHAHENAGSSGPVF